MSTGSTLKDGKSLGVIDVRGEVMSVTPARVFNKTNSPRDKVVQDYYHVTIVTGKKNRVKLYFPVSTHSTAKWKNARKIDISVRGDDGKKWFKHDLKNPSLLVGRIIEASGFVQEEGASSYYMNRITRIKIF